MQTIQLQRCRTFTLFSPRWPTVSRHTPGAKESCSLKNSISVTKDVDRLDPVLVKLRTNPLNLTNPGDVDYENYQMALTLGIPYLAVCTESPVGHP